MAHVPSANLEEEPFMTYGAAHHQGAVENSFTFEEHLISPIFKYSQQKISNLTTMESHKESSRPLRNGSWSLVDLELKPQRLILIPLFKHFVYCGL